MHISIQNVHAYMYISPASKFSLHRNADSKLKPVVTNTNQTWQQPQHFDTIPALAVLPPSLTSVRGATSCAPQLENPPSLHASALISDPLALNSIFGSSKQHGALHTIMHDIPSELQGKEAVHEIHSLSKKTSRRTQSALDVALYRRGPRGVAFSTPTPTAG